MNGTETGDDPDTDNCEKECEEVEEERFCIRGSRQFADRGRNTLYSNARPSVRPHANTDDPRVSAAVGDQVSVEGKGTVDELEGKESHCTTKSSNGTNTG
jgi:hypothetical protein